MIRVSCSIRGVVVVHSRGATHNHIDSGTVQYCSLGCRMRDCLVGRDSISLVVLLLLSRAGDLLCSALLVALLSRATRPGISRLLDLRRKWH